MTATITTTVVDGVEIPDFLIAEEVQHHPSANPMAARAAAGKALAVRALLLHRADELGLRPQPLTDEDGREETAEEALIRATLDAEVEIDPPSAGECRRVYDAHPGRFSTPALSEAAHILVEPKSDDAEGWEVARRTAETALERLLREPGVFSQVARSLSDCPSGAVGGSLGQLGPGDVVGEVESALAGLPAGEILDRPLRSRFGWHLLKLERRIEGQTLPFDYVEDKIRLHLESRAWTAAATRYVADLAERARAQGVAFSLTRDGRFAEGAPSLGEMLSDDAGADRLEAWMDATDPALAERVRLAAAADGLPVDVFVRRAVRHFVDHADDEKWTQLISATQGAADPALAAMASLLKAKLAAKPTPGAPHVHTYTVISRR